MFSAALERLYAQRAPRHEFEFQNIPSTKVDKQLLVVMDKAKAEKVIIPNPGAMSDNFRCEAGPHYDYYRLTDLKDHKIDLGSALWSNKKFNVYIGYTFLDGSPNTPISTQTAGDNTNRFSGGDMATAINPFVFIGTGKAENMRGKAGSIERDGQQLWFAGGGDLWEDHIGFDQVLNHIPDDACRSMLGHNPDSADSHFSGHIDLILAGHTHGGQVRIPFWGAPVLPVRNKAYASGVIRSSKGHTMFISRGIGWAIYPVRFNCFPEIAVVTLV